MKSARRVLLVSVGLTLVLLALISCGGKSATPTPTIDPTELLLEAEQNTIALASLGFEMEMEMDLKSDGMSVSLDFDGEGVASGDFESIIFDSGSYDMEVNIPGLGEEKIKARIVNNRLEVRTPGGNWLDAGTMEDLDEGLFSGPGAIPSFEDLVDGGVITVRSVGAETIDGTSVQRLTLNYDLERVKELLSGELLSLVGEALPGEEITFESVDRYRSDVWVSSNDRLIRKQDLEYSVTFSMAGMEFDTTVLAVILIRP